MRVPGSWAYFLTTGHWISLDGGLIRTWDPTLTIPHPEPETLLFLWLTRTNGFKVIGKGQNTGDAWMWTEAGGRWKNIGPTFNNQPVAFDNFGTPFIAPASFGSQGVRYFDEHNQPVTGDDTYNEERRVARALGITKLWEYTHLGGITVGQGEDGVHAIFDDDPARLHHLIMPGNCRFVHVDWDPQSPDGFGISTTLLGTNTSEVRWYDRASLRNLPIVGAPVVVPPVVVPPVIPPVKPPKEPTVPAFPFDFNPTGRLEALRAGFPTPLGARHPEFLVKACKVVGNGAGLLKKDGGTHVTLPNEVNVSQDWMVFQNGSGTDFLSDGEGAATIGWGAAQANPGTWVDVSGLFTEDPPIDPPVDPPVDPPDPTHPPDTTDHDLILRLFVDLEAMVKREDHLEARLDALTPQAPVDLSLYAKRGDPVTVSVKYLGAAHGHIDG